MTSAPLEDLEPAFRAAAVLVDADRRVRRVATDSASLPEIRFMFDADADDQADDQAVVRAAAVTTAAVTRCATCAAGAIEAVTLSV